MPIPPPAPVLFSITTGVFNSRESASANGLPTISATPPGGKGTISEMGRDGNGSCAVAAKATSQNAMTATCRRVNERTRMNASCQAIDISEHVLAAVDRNVRAGDKRGFFARQIGDESCNFLRLAEPPHRDLRN